MIILQWLFWCFAWMLVSLRYWTKVIGMKAVKQKPGPYLVMPNHPGFADPPNVIMNLWPHFRFRPVVNEINFQNPITGPMAWLIRTINVPDMEHTSADAHKRAQEAVQVVIRALKQGDNVVLWPSGRLMRDGMERLGGARAVSDILAACPEVTVVLVRTRGLWGSSWSWANGPIPPLFPLVFRSLGVLLANLIVLAPRRQVTMTLEAFTAAERPGTKRDTLNAWLEGWYNADTPPHQGSPWPGETPTFVPYHFLFGPRSHDYPPPFAEPELNLAEISAEVKRGVSDIIAEKLKRQLTDKENQAGTTFLELGIDSLDGMDIALQVEQRFGFNGDEVPQKIGQLWAIGSGLASTSTIKPPPPNWFQAPSDTNPIEILGSTIGEAFVRRCLKHPKDIAAADDLAGVQTYERLLLGAMLMSRRFRDLAEPNIGLMLPASVAGDLALMGLHLAGKLPVILNWTTGPVNLAHAVKLMGLKHVVSSRAFIDRTNLAVEGTEFLFLEDVRKSIGRLEGAFTLAQLRLFPSSAINSALSEACRDADKPCVVLFTSGSEKAPKAVPLTHANVLANLNGIMPVFQFTRGDSVLGFLPLFHSFGHTVTGVFPLLVGFKTLHHPDPTDANGLVRKIASYKPTLMAGTPGFLSFIVERAKPGELESLRMIVVGAEKCPETLFRKVKELASNAIIIEGYGITECSPIIAANPPEKPKPGSIGKPLFNVDTKIVDVESHQPIALTERGLLYVHGPSIFHGYLGSDNASPFQMIDGQPWYNTGDLASFDEEGYIIFHGRLKRFIKAGGEMISLPALEEPFTLAYPPTDQGPRVAVEGIETPTGRRVVLFTTEAMALKDANALLQQNGFRGVMRLDEVKTLERIPVLGTGKTDYKVLRTMIEVE